MSKSRILKVLFSIFSLLGLLIHCGFIIDQYMEYNTMNSIKIRLVDQGIFPAVTICFYTQYLMPPGFNFKNASNQEITDKSADLRKYCKKVSNMSIHYRNQARTKCLTVIEAPMGDRIVRSFSFILNFETLKDVYYPTWFLFHDPEIRAYSRDTTKAEFGPVEKKSGGYVAFTYDFIESQLLPEPSSDRCLGYEKEKFESRGHCVSECQSKTMMAQKGVDIFNLDAISDNFSRPISGRKKSSAIMSYFKIARECDLKCLFKCNSKSYIPVFLKFETYVPHQLDIKISRGRPQTLIKSDYELPMSGLIVYLAGIVGVWTGFNVLTISYKISDLGALGKKSRFKKKSIDQIYNKMTKMSGEIKNLKDQIRLSRIRI